MAENKIILVTTDKSVLDNNSINEILKSFKDPSIGCVTGRPMPLASRKNMFGYWSHLLLDAGAHKIRKELSSKEQFLECTNFLFAFKNGFVKEISTDISEDHLIPYLFWKNNYKIKYLENARVYITSPLTLDNWLKQKTENTKKQENLIKYLNKKGIKIPVVKSFKNEILRGAIAALTYPKTLKEFYWTILLFFARLSMWINVIIKKS